MKISTQTAAKTSPKTKKPPIKDGKAMNAPATYIIEGKTFIAEPVFKSEGRETIGTVLIKLMKNDCENCNKNF
jgi:hypothetical protein